MKVRTIIRRQINLAEYVGDTLLVWREPFQMLDQYDQFARGNRFELNTSLFGLANFCRHIDQALNYVAVQSRSSLLEKLDLLIQRQIGHLLMSEAIDDLSVDLAVVRIGQRYDFRLGIKCDDGAVLALKTAGL